MRKTFYILLGLTALFLYGFEKESNKIDSIKQLISAINNDTVKINTLLEIGSEYTKIDSSLAFGYYQQAYNISVEINNKPFQGKSLSKLAFAQHKLNNFKKSINYSLKASEIHLQINNASALMRDYNRIAVAYYNLSNYDSAYMYYKKAYECSKKVSDIAFNIKLYGNMGGISNSLGNYDKALYYFNQAIAESEKINDETKLKITYLNIGNTYYYLANYPQANYYYQQGLKISELLNDKPTKALYLANIANIQAKLENNSLALENYKKALAIHRETGKVRSSLSTLNNMGILYKKEGNDSLAMSIHIEALELARSVKMKSAESHALYLIALLHQSNNEYNLALSYLDSALVINMAINKPRTISRDYFAIAGVYKDLGNYNKALWYSNKSLKINTKLQGNDALQNSYKQISDIYAHLNDHEKAFKYHKEYKLLNDSIYSLENIKSVTAMEMQYRFDKEMKIAELESLRKSELHNAQIEKQTMVRNILLVGFSILFLLILYILKLLSTKQKTNKILIQKNKQINIQNTELEKVISSKNTFISILGHDLKNVIGGNIGIIDMLEQKGENWDRKNEFLGYIYANTHAAYNLLNDVVTWGKASLGKTRYSPDAISLKKIFEKQELLFASQIKQKEINLTLICNDDLTVFADENMLRTILRNVINNAIKYTNTKGGIILEAKKTSNNIELSVSDNGIGMPQEKADSIFKLNSIQPEPGTNGESGNGLGLQIVREYIASHKATISVNSSLGKGTKVCMLFPNIKLESLKNV